MRRFVTDLLEGPSWLEDRSWQTVPAEPLAGSWLVIPLLLLCSAMAGAAIAGLAELHHAALAALVIHMLPHAALAACLCLMAAIPAALASAPLLWLLPLWFAPAIGMAGWSLLQLPSSDMSEMLGVAVIRLPVAVGYLFGTLACIRPGMMEAASSSGHSPGGAFGRIMLLPALAMLPRAFLLMFLLTLSLLVDVRTP